MAFALVAVAAFDLVSYQRGFHPATPIAWANPPEPPLIREMNARIGHDRMGGLVEMQPNLANRFRVRDVRKYDSPVLERRYDLWVALGGLGSDQMVLPPEATRAADVFSVRWLMSYALAAKETRRWRPAGVGPIVENRFALPRAWMAYAWRPAKDEKDALRQVVGATERVNFREPVLEGAEGAPSGAADAPGTVQFLSDGERGVRLVVDAKKPGRLVLNDTWYPGWKADVDGRSVPIEHANVAFRAVRVPAGHHTVTFGYQPASARVGAGLTLLAAAIIAALLFVSPSGTRGYRSRRRGSPATSAGDRP
jgi:hypothetical protein